MSGWDSSSDEDDGKIFYSQASDVAILALKDEDFEYFRAHDSILSELIPFLVNVFKLQVPTSSFPDRVENETEQEEELRNSVISRLMSEFRGSDWSSSPRYRGKSHIGIEDDIDNYSLYVRIFYWWLNRIPRQPSNWNRACLDTAGEDGSEPQSEVIEEGSLTRPVAIASSQETITSVNEPELDKGSALVVKAYNPPFGDEEDPRAWGIPRTHSRSAGEPAFEDSSNDLAENDELSTSDNEECGTPTPFERPVGSSTDLPPRGPVDRTLILVSLIKKIKQKYPRYHELLDSEEGQSLMDVLEKSLDSQFKVICEQGNFDLER